MGNVGWKIDRSEIEPGADESWNPTSFVANICSSALDKGLQTGGKGGPTLLCICLNTLQSLGGWHASMMKRAF